MQSLLGDVSLFSVSQAQVDGFLIQLLVALHPLVLFIAMWLTSEDAGYDWVAGGGGGGNVTEYNVCVLGHDTLNLFFPVISLFWLRGSFMVPII